MEQRQSLQQIVLEQLDIHMPKKKNPDPDFITFTKINSKWILHLNIKQEAIKLLKDNIGENLHDLGYGDGFLDTTPKT